MPLALALRRKGIQSGTAMVGGHASKFHIGRQSGGPLAGSDENAENVRVPSGSDHACEMTTQPHAMLYVRAEYTASGMYAAYQSRSRFRLAANAATHRIAHVSPPHFNPHAIARTTEPCLRVLRKSFESMCEI